MLKFVLHISLWIISFIKKIVGINITVSGDIPRKSSLLFLSNHFTRFETFLVPYVLYSKYRHASRSLGDDSVFVGLLGKYMRLAGTISTQNLKKEKIISDDLISAEADWIIYPEGYMIKNKRISFDEEFHIHTSDKESSIFTGSAALALKAEIARSKLTNPSNKAVKIVPLTISYYPIRPGRNRLLLLIDKYINIQGTHFFEELEIELNLLRHSNIHFHFSEPILVSDYIKEDLEMTDDERIDTQRKPLTNAVMKQVYSSLQINFDHIFILSLLTMPTLKISPNYLKALIYKNTRSLKKIDGLQIHPQLQHELFTLILKDDYEPFVSAIKLALNQKILYEDSEGDYLFDKSLLEKEYDFNKIRIKNTFQVILNEIKWKQNVVNIAYKNAELTYKQLQKNNFEYLKNKEWRTFKDEHLLYRNKLPEKSDIGTPIILKRLSHTIGLVFSHGYMASPREARYVAKYLFEKGINVYVPRLRGHATDPEALKHITSEDWEYDFKLAFTLMRQTCDKVFVGGFSMGGLLALIHASEFKVDGVIVINSALRLNNLQVTYVVPALHAFNEMAASLNAKGVKDWIVNNSENSKINYAKHPFESIVQMEKIMKKTDQNLKNINAPILILQGDNDPVVNPKSAQLIYEGVSSRQKKLILIPRDNHIIISKQEDSEVFNSIYRFIKDVTKL